MLLPLSLAVAMAPLSFAQRQKPIGGSALAGNDFRAQEHSQGYKFDPLLHLPGISPYFDAVGFGLEHKAPLGCNVTAATYLVRHAAIYANDKDYEKFMEPFLEKLEGSVRSKWTGPLAFLETWANPYTDPENQMEEITPSGADDATLVAKHLISRYPDLALTTKKIYVDKKSRTQDTGKAFVKAFSQEVEVVQIKEEKEFHATIPHKYCPAFTKKAGDVEFNLIVGVYTAPVLSRLQRHAPVDLTPRDIVGLQQLCGYESAINGKVSEICGVFTPTEWMGYEYAWDVKYQYMVGHGNKLSPYLGFPWLNVTAALFRNLEDLDADLDASRKDDNDDANEGQRFFLSFTHREVPPFLATALGLFDSASDTPEVLSTSHINFGRSWKMAELIPFLGHIGIEKMTCDATSGAEADGGSFVRIIANSAPRPIPTCEGGPGASCGMEEFQEFVRDGMERYGDFHGVCGDHQSMGGEKIFWQ